MMKNKIKTLKDLEERANHLIKVIVQSGNKREITKTFLEIECLITGSCICDLCPEWDKDTYILYEFGRCIVPTKILQLVKERHYNTKRWVYVQPLYTSLYEKLFDDILPTTSPRASLNNEAKAICNIRISLPEMQK
jgi:hypothetical protein